MKRFVVAAAFLLLTAGLTRADDPPTDDAAICKKAVDLLSAGKQAEAERLIFDQARDHPAAGVNFLAAVLTRSRFDLEAADPLLDAVAEADPDGLNGQTAKLVAAIDRGQETKANFAALDKLSADHPDAPLVLWMVAVECRQLHKNHVGIARYQTLLKTWDPGPSLVHQTFGNLLLDNNRPAEALAQYDLAIGQEPASWGYNCRGNALVELKRYDDAAAAYKKGTELNPDYTLTWSNWALLCDKQNDPDGAAEKRAKVAEIRAKAAKGPPPKRPN